MAQRRIVLADDDQQIRSFVKAILKAQGLDVNEAGDGQEAAELLEKLGGLVDLLITDIKMPRMDGVTLATAVAEIYPPLFPCCSFQVGLSICSMRRNGDSPNTHSLESHSCPRLSSVP